MPSSGFSVGTIDERLHALQQTGGGKFDACLGGNRQMARILTAEDEDHHGLRLALEIVKLSLKRADIILPPQRHEEL